MSPTSSSDRPRLCEAFKDWATPAKDFTSPVVADRIDSLPGSEVLAFDPERAKELWEQANAIDPW